MSVVCIFERMNPEIDAPRLEDISIVDIPPEEHLRSYIEELDSCAEGEAAINDYGFFLVEEEVGRKLTDIEDFINTDSYGTGMEVRYVLYELLRKFEKEV